jgi:hypothetical protein
MRRKWIRCSERCKIATKGRRTLATTPDFMNYDELSRMKLLSRLFARKPVPKTEEEIAALIEGFANGTGGRWDWDYFISTDFENEPSTGRNSRLRKSFCALAGWAGVTSKG